MSLQRQPDYSLSSSPAPAAQAQERDATAFLPRVEPGRIGGFFARRWWLLALGLMLALGAAAAYVKQASRIFESKGSLYISAKTPRMMEAGAVAPEETKDLEQMRSVEQALVASTLLGHVIDAGKLAEDPTFAGQTTSRQQLIGVLAKMVKVELRRGTRLIDISVQDTDPARAKRLVETLVSEYERWSADRQGGLTRQVADGIRGEEEALRTRMEQSERTLQEFREAHPIPGITGRNGPIGDDLGRVESELSKVKAERFRLESELSALRGFDPALPDSASALATGERAASINGLVRTVQQKENDFLKIKERYLEKHPTYMEAASELSGLKRNLAEAANSAIKATEKKYLVAKDNESKMEAEVERTRTSVVATEGLRARFEALERDAIAERTTHEAVAGRLRDTSIAAAIPGPVLRWEDAPMIPEKPVKPDKRVVFGLAAFGGLFLGLLMAVGFELTDGRVRDSAAAARAIGTPLLSVVSTMAEGGTGEMVLLSQPGSETSEGFRRLRAALSSAPGRSGPTTILFTSAKPGEGRSFCAMNYAASLAMQGMRTLLLDADMRRPGLSLQHLRSQDGKFGLSDYLTGAAEPAKTCYPTTLPNLYLLSSGNLQANAVELLSGTRFPALLDEAHRWFDCVVIDTPPVLSSSDTLAIARYADRVCLVVSERASERRELRRAADLIRSSGGNLAGFIWNEIPAKARAESDGGPSLPVLRSLLKGAPAAEIVLPARRPQPPISDMPA
jgi:polysaccharide biosynthesis transport protein